MTVGVPRRSRLSPGLTGSPVVLRLAPWLVAGVLMVLAACSSSSSGPVLSAPAQEGRTIAFDAGCVACHGRDGQGGAGPAWVKLAGSTVTLADGTSVVADRQYLTRAITEPRAQVAVGFTIVMPANNLSADQVERVVDYIEALR